MVFQCPICGGDTYWVDCTACSGGHYFCGDCKREFWLCDGQLVEVVIEITEEGRKEINR